MPLVTVVVSIFNGSRFIEGFAEYFGQQEFKDTEVIFVVDSKTTDDTVKKIERMKSTIPESTILMQNDNLGLGGSRNIGLDAAKGKYVWFVDVDDRPYPDFLSTMVKLAEDNEADVSICNFVKSFDLNTKVPDKKYTVKIMSREEVMLDLIKDKIPVVIWSKLMKVDFLRKKNLKFSSGYIEDVDYTYRMLSECSKAVYCSKPLYLYHQNPTSFCASSNNERGRTEVKAYGKLFGTLDSGNLKNMVQRRCVVMMMRSSVHMDYATYTEYIKSKEFRDVADKHLRNPLSPEYVCVRVLPSLYYIGLQFYLKFFYGREKRYYNKY